MKAHPQSRTSISQNYVNSGSLLQPQFMNNPESAPFQSLTRLLLGTEDRISSAKSNDQIKLDFLKFLIDQRSNQQRLMKGASFSLLRSQEGRTQCLSGHQRHDTNEAHHSFLSKEMPEQNHQPGSQPLQPFNFSSSNSTFPQNHYFTSLLFSRLGNQIRSFNFAELSLLHKFQLYVDISRQIKFLINLESVKSLLPALALDQQLALSLELHELQQIATPALYQLMRNVSCEQARKTQASHFNNQLRLKLQQRSRKFELSRQGLIDYLEEVPDQDAIVLRGSPRPQLRRDGTPYRSSPYRGVFRNGTRFQIFVMIDGRKKLYRGGFKEPKEASYLYDKAVIQLRGLKARTNRNYTKKDVLSILNEPPVFKHHEIEDAPHRNYI